MMIPIRLFYAYSTSAPSTEHRMRREKSRRNEKNRKQTRQHCDTGLVYMIGLDKSDHERTGTKIMVTDAARDLCEIKMNRTEEKACEKRMHDEKKKMVW